MGGNLFGIGLGELIFLAILALVIFGPRRLPQIARTVGQIVRQARELSAGFDQEMRRWMEETEEASGWREIMADTPSFSAPPAHPTTGLEADADADPGSPSPSPDEEEPDPPVDWAG